MSQRLPLRSLFAAAALAGATVGAALWFEAETDGPLALTRLEVSLQAGGDDLAPGSRLRLSLLLDGTVARFWLVPGDRRLWPHSIAGFVFDLEAPLPAGALRSLTLDFTPPPPAADRRPSMAPPAHGPLPRRCVEPAAGFG